MALLIVIVAICFLITSFFLVVSLIRIRTAFFGAPFVPSADAKLAIMIKLAKIKPGQKVVDLGSGNGKILFALAKYPIEIHGYEIDPYLVWRTRRQVRKQQLEQKVFIHNQNFLRADLSQYDVIFLYGITYIMKKLGKKLQNELKPGGKIISNYFQFPNWKPTKEENGVLLYTKY